MARNHLQHMTLCLRFTQEISRGLGYQAKSEAPVVRVRALHGPWSIEVEASPPNVTPYIRKLS